jgi:hypothetical protein
MSSPHGESPVRPSHEPAPSESQVPCPAAPAINSPGPSYYLFSQDSGRMAVTLLKKGDRVRLDALELVVLDVHDGTVELGVWAD